MKQTPLPVVSMMVLACSLLLGLAGGLWALDGTEGGDTATGALPSLQQGGASEESRGTPPLTKEQQILEMDIATSSLLELASWCRRLGLSEGGTREELQNRLRQYYGIPLSKGSDASGKEQISSSEKPKTPEKTSSPRTIVIESAEQSEFFTLDVVNEEYARLRGKVQITIKEGDTSYTLSAEELLYNKTRNQLSARGNVIYTKKKGEVIETFRGTALSLNLDSLSGAFLGGFSERAMEGKSNAYKFTGQVISRDAEGSTVLQDVDITTASVEEPYWSIHASKLWLLPGNDWAIAHAVLKVGELPLFYIPFLYLPGDEVVFHPVLGYRNREGSFVQTTTYLLGRPKASSSTENSITRLLGSSENEERRLEGVFLRATGERRKSGDEVSLAILFDMYANLGAYGGLELSIPKNGAWGKQDVSMGIGFSRTIYPLGSSLYSPYNPIDGSIDWNSAYFLNWMVPFRYRFKATGSLSLGTFSLSWTIPVYSDPYVDDDFLDRSEQMDWLSMIKEGASAGSSSSSSSNILGSYNLRIGGSGTIPTDVLSPLISSFTVNSLSSTLIFKTKSSTLYASSSSPWQSFFYPSQWTLASFSGNVRGTLFSNSVKKSPSSELISEDGKKANLLDSALSPWTEERSPQTIPGAEGPQKQADTSDSFTIPALSQTFEGSGGAQYLWNVEYSLDPTASWDLHYHYSKWKEVYEVNWSDISYLYSILGINGTIASNFSRSDNLFTMSFKIGGNANWQHYQYIDTSASDIDANSLLLSAYKASGYYLTAESTFTLRPLVQDEMWKNSQFQYTLKGKWLSTVFNNDVQDPRWDLLWGSWSKDYISSHSLSATLSALTSLGEQSLGLSMELPPRESLLSGNTRLQWGASSLSANTSISKPFEDPLFNPLTVSGTVVFAPRFQYKQDLTYTPEEKSLTSWISTLSWYDLSASLSYAYSKSYLFSGGKWTLASDEEALRPKAFQLSYGTSLNNLVFWKNRIQASLNISSSLSLDLQRYTYSSFTFSLGTTVKIHEFLDFSFTSKSQNRVIYRYIQSWPIWEQSVQVPGEQNMLVDLLNSFRFDSDTLRKSSGFKLQALSVKAVHYMGDWTATLTTDLEPYLDTSQLPYRYAFNTKVSFLVQWIPISEFKTQTYYDKDGFVFK
ncbi:LPS-assembly protein LptD [Treponema sp. J25]|uniref:LPS-assembly protein LptD n=1 Tax=Treponema sp. J25 TaxID=2094121 RepID=UPI0010470A68|nr:LPS-assembly protein LptD [Treponema sp. J25]TCW60064.1 LPS-assembly protein LptD [Treponema sp. J25]